jgi:hypothetical protein
MTPKELQALVDELVGDHEDVIAPPLAYSL